MRHYRQRGRAIWSLSVVAALCAAVAALATLTSQPIQAQPVGASSQGRPADSQIAFLLGKIETLLGEGRTIAPPGNNATEVFGRVLALASAASPAGLQLMADFPSALKRRADAEQAAGHSDISMQFEIFAEVVSSISAPRGARPDVQSPTPGQPETRPEMTGANAAAEQDATRRAAPPDEMVIASKTESERGELPALAPSQTTTTPEAEPASQTRRAVGSPASEAPTTSAEVPARGGPSAPTAAVSVRTGAEAAPQALPAPSNQQIVTAAAASGGPSAPTAAVSVRTDAEAVPQALGAPSNQQTVTAAAASDVNATANVSRGSLSPKGSGTTQVAALPRNAPTTAAPARNGPDRVGPGQVPVMPPAMIDALLKRGDAMLAIGDISAARLLFTRAADGGSGRAAIALGDTYNPVFLAAHGVVGPRGDIESAASWYRKALGLGEPGASDRLAKLGEHAKPMGLVNSQ